MSQSHYSKGLTQLPLILFVWNLVGFVFRRVWEEREEPPCQLLRLDSVGITTERKTEKWTQEMYIQHP